MQGCRSKQVIVQLIIFYFVMLAGQFGFTSEVSNSYKNCIADGGRVNSLPSQCHPGHSLTSYATSIRNELFACDNSQYYYLTSSLRIDKSTCGPKQSCWRSEQKDDCVPPEILLAPRSRSCGFIVNGILRCIKYRRQGQADRVKPVVRLASKAFSDLSLCFTEKHVHSQLADVVNKLLNDGVTIKCPHVVNDSLKDPLLMFQISASISEEERTLELYDKYFGNLQFELKMKSGEAGAVEDLAHEFLHFSPIQNTSTRIHNLGRKKVGNRDRVYACSRLCSKDPMAFLTQEECHTCLSYPGPITEVEQCKKFIPNIEFENYNKALDSRDCSTGKTKEQCKLENIESKIQYIDGLISRYPNDNVNFSMLIGTKRNFQRSRLHTQTKIGCHRLAKAPSDTDIQSDLKKLIREWERMRDQVEITLNTLYERGQVDLPDPTIEAYCKDVPEF